MAITYDPIATTTLSSLASSITFSSITSAYTDLRLVIACTNSSGGDQVFLTFNGTGGTSYSQTYLYGDGAIAAAGNSGNQPNINAALIGTSTTIPTTYMIDIFSYSGSTNKTCLIVPNEDKNGAGGVSRQVGLWRNTSAITSITISKSSGNYVVGTRATLYGIKAA